MDECDISGLLLKIHEGPFEKPYWHDFLHALRKLTGADYVSLAFKRPFVAATETSVMRAGWPDDDPYRDMLTDFFRDSAFPHGGLEPGVVYRMEEMLNESIPDHAKYRKYLSLRGFKFSRMIRIKEPEGANAWLAIQKGAADFPGDVDNVLSRISPHLSISIRHLMLHERESIRAQVASDAVRRLNFSWFTLDVSGRVVELDLAAGHLFRNLPMRNVAAGGMFPSPTPAAHQAITDALTAFNAAPRSQPRAIHLLDEPWVDMLALPIQERSISNDVSPVAVFYVYRSQVHDVSRSDRLMELFALTRTEARLALALSQGQGIPAAAEKLGLTLETARNYSKKIYAKTSTRSQADLVRLIMASIVAIT